MQNHPFINAGKAMIEQWMKLQAIEKEINLKVKV